MMKLESRKKDVKKTFETRVLCLHWGIFIEDDQTAERKQRIK